MRTYEVRVSRALSPSRLPEYDYALNPYVGCLHGCLYCYAIDLTRGPPAALWGSLVYVKVNLAEVLRREVRRLPPGVVGISTLTDPYLPAEARYRLMRAVIPTLAEAGFHASIQTRSGLVVRDLDLLARYRDRVDLGLTITTMSDKARILEPHAAHPLARARALEKAAAAGIRSWIFLGPIVPGFNDGRQDIEPVVQLAARLGLEVTYDRYRPRPRAHALLTARYRPVEATQAWWRAVESLVRSLCREHGAVCRSAEEEWAEARRRRRPQST